jgi:hypothetical protein
MRLFITALLFLTLIPRLAIGEIHGDMISGVSNTNVIQASPVTTNSAPLLATNAVSQVGFDKLAGFPVTLTDELEFNTNRPAWADAQINAMIPGNILALDHHEIEITGFMVPVRFEKDKVVEFMLSRDPPACCYATMPQIHEWISVQVKSPGVTPMEYSVVRARGVLGVGAKRQEGTLSSLYRMDAVKVIEEK